MGTNTQQHQDRAVYDDGMRIRCSRQDRQKPRDRVREEETGHEKGLPANLRSALRVRSSKRISPLAV